MRPDYYKGKTGRDALDVIFEFDLDFCSGNVFKYLVRAGKKGDRMVDLRKAQEYLRRLVEQETGVIDAARVIPDKSGAL